MVERNVFSWGCVSEMTEKALNGHKQAAAYEWKDFHGGYGLTSYRTQIIHVSEDGWMVVSGTFSRTTIKHIGWFVKQHNLPSYYEVKAMFEKGLAMNVLTGETRPMTPSEKKWAKTQRQGTRIYY